MIARIIACVTLGSCLLLTPAAAMAAAPQPGEPIACEFPAVDRVVAIGQVGGEIDRLKEMLQQVELVNEDGHWIGGKAHLVQLGNCFGKRGSVDAVLIYLKALSDEAEQAGGMVHVLLGQTEEMVFENTASQLNPNDYARFASDNSEQMRQALLEKQLKEFELEYGDLADFAQLRQNFINFFNLSTKPGAAEFFKTIAPGTELGDWIRSRNAVIRIGDVLFSQLGVSPQYANLTLPEINNKVRQHFQGKQVFLQLRIDKASPLWWQDLIKFPEETVRQSVDDIARRLGVKAIVIGLSRINETEQKWRITYVESSLTDRSGRQLSALEIEKGNFKIYRAGATIEYGSPPPLPEKPASTPKNQPG